MNRIDVFVNRYLLSCASVTLCCLLVMALKRGTISALKEGRLAGKAELELLCQLALDEFLSHSETWWLKPGTYLFFLEVCRLAKSATGSLQVLLVYAAHGWSCPSSLIHLWSAGEPVWFWLARMDLCRTVQLSSTCLQLKSHESIFMFHSFNTYWATFQCVRHYMTLPSNRNEF